MNFESLVMEFFHDSSRHNHDFHYRMYRFRSFRVPDNYTAYHRNRDKNCYNHACHYIATGNSHTGYSDGESCQSF